jgi:hypothetical protein
MRSPSIFKAECTREASRCLSRTRVEQPGGAATSTPWSPKRRAVVHRRILHKVTARFFAVTNYQSVERVCPVSTPEDLRRGKV